jgi:hypothetical protein
MTGTKVMNEIEQYSPAYDDALEKKTDRDRAYAVVRHLYNAWLKGGLTTEEYYQSLNDLELITGIHWSMM